jgi:hypothetical protein
MLTIDAVVEMARLEATLFPMWLTAFPSRSASADFFFFLFLFLFLSRQKHTVHVSASSQTSAPHRLGLSPQGPAMSTSPSLAW